MLIARGHTSHLVHPNQERRHKKGPSTVRERVGGLRQVRSMEEGRRVTIRWGRESKREGGSAREREKEKEEAGGKEKEGAGR